MSQAMKLTLKLQLFYRTIEAIPSAERFFYSLRRTRDIEKSTAVFDHITYLLTFTLYETEGTKKAKKYIF